MKDLEELVNIYWAILSRVYTRCSLFFELYSWLYTLGKKGCYTPIEDNKTNVDRTFVFPLGWNWHDMDPWLFPNKIQHYLGQTFNARSSGMVELRNHSIGGRSPKSIFTLWQLWINICIFFQKFFWLFEQCPVQPLWVLGMRCLHFPVRALSKVLLLPVWVWLVLPWTAYSKGMLPLDLWCQASLQGLPLRQHLGKTMHCWGWSDRIVSWVLRPWRRGWEICTEWGLVAQRLTTDSCPVVTGHIDPQRSPCGLPTTVVSVWSGRRGGGGHWQHVIFGDESRFQLYAVDGRLRVRRLPDERFRPGCQAHRVQAGGGSVHVWGAFHNSAKSPLVLPDGYLTGVLYRDILQNTLVPFARHHFGDNYRYQDDNATPHRVRVVLNFLQQGNVTKMEQPPRSPDCNPIEHLWDELGRAISSMDNPPQNLDELRQALLDKWAQIPVQRLQRLVASMPRRLAAIIAARGGNTRYWPGTHKTRPPGSVTKKIIFVWPNLPHLSSSDI